jgi:hypothetical protein
VNNFSTGRNEQLSAHKKGNRTQAAIRESKTPRPALAAEDEIERIVFDVIDQILSYRTAASHL